MAFQRPVPANPTEGFAFAKPTRAPKDKPRFGIKARRPRRLDTAQSDPLRISWLHTQTCALLAFDPSHCCSGRIEACHEGRKPGTAMKCADSETIPLCSGAHRDWTNHRGFFAGWLKMKRREWADSRIAETTARYLAHGGRRG